MNDAPLWSPGAAGGGAGPVLTRLPKSYAGRRQCQGRRSQL